MPGATSDPAKPHCETGKVLPVLFVTSNIAILYVVYLVAHLIPLLQDPDSHGRAVIETFAFHIVTVLLVICYVNCILIHPGTIPDEDASWEYIPKPQEPGADALAQEMKRSGDRRHCKWCAKYKPDRCHHCRICKTCVLRMDHHCPWVYNCVGFRNHKFFFLLLFYSAVDCHIITWTMLESLIHAVDGGTTLFTMFVLLLAEILAALFGLLVTAFFSFHCWLMLRAMTTIEFCEKSARADGGGASVYDRGVYGNVQAVLGDNAAFWLCPWSPPSGGGLYFLDGTPRSWEMERAPLSCRKDEGPRAGRAARRHRKIAGTGSAGGRSEPTDSESEPLLAPSPRGPLGAATVG